MRRLKHLFQFSVTSMHALAFMVIWIAAMSLTGCSIQDAKNWVAGHPQDVQKAEKVAEDAGEAALKAAETDL